MRAVLKGKTQEFIQGGVTSSGLATQMRRGIIKSFDAATYRATVQLLGSLSVWLEGIPVAKHLGSNLLSNGTRCGVLFFDESNPNDACVAFVYDGLPAAWITSGLVVDGAITAADCLSNVAGGVATIDASGDLNPPNHVRAVGRFYPGGQTAGYLVADATGKLALMGGNVGLGTAAPSSLLHLKAAEPRARFEQGAGGQEGGLEWYESSTAKAFITYRGDAAEMRFFVGGGTSGDIKMVIEDSGEIGIGEMDPARLLHIKGSASRAPAWRLTTGAGGTSKDLDVSGDEGNRRFDFQVREGAGSWLAPITIKTDTGNVGIGTTSPSSFKLQVSGDMGGTGYIYPGSGSAVQNSRYIKDDGSHLVSYGGLALDIGSGDTPLVFRKTGNAKWLNYVYSGNDSMRWASYSGGWQDKMALDASAGDLSIDGSYSTFSPAPPKADMSPEDYLAWAMEDASKPLKPYPGIPKEPAELERYRKDISKIAIGVARYVDHLRTQVAALESRLSQAGW